ncbi:MAG: MATE family efflux transporter, partial [Pseudomonadota bacterium]
MRHIIVMSLSASVGLIALFVVDFIDLYFISLLGDTALTAAVGFAGTLMAFGLSVSIGLMIAMSALGA